MILSKIPGLRSKRKWIRILAGIGYFYLLLSIIIVIIALAQSSKEKPQEKQTQNSDQVQENGLQKEEPPVIEKPQVPDISTMELTKENVILVLSSFFEPKTLSEVILSENSIEVFYIPGVVWDEKHLMQKSASMAAQTFEQLFKRENIESVFFYTVIEMTDMKGNSSKETGIVFHLSHNGAQGINWPVFRNMVDSDYMALVKVCDSTTVHPGIRSKL